MGFEISRSTSIAASPGRVLGLVDDFHQWVQWSPWEGLDPEMQRSYSGPESGIGARYSWKGNRKAGEGSMEITGSGPGGVDIALTFLKPWKATNPVRIVLSPQAASTGVTWTMTGEHVGFMKVLALVLPMDRLVGKDFEKGLARLKAVAEHSA